MNGLSKDSLTNKFLAFRLNDDEFGLSLNYVLEIIGIQPITDLPDTPDYVVGVINLRHKIIPVMDLRTRFHMQLRQYDERTCIIVLNVNGRIVGIIVDTVLEVIEIKEEQFQQELGLSPKQNNPFIEGIVQSEDSVQVIVNVEKLVSAENFQPIADVLASKG